MDVDGERRVCGFYVTCCVDAGSESAAGERALAVLRADPEYQSMLAGRDGFLTPPAAPAVFVDEVAQLDSPDSQPLGISTGFVFYSDDPEELPLA